MFSLLNYGAVTKIDCVAYPESINFTSGSVIECKEYTIDRKSVH